MRTAFAFALLALSTPALANNETSQQTAASESATTDSAKSGAAEERKICKRMQSTESRLGAKKVCMTKAQWREYMDAND